MKQLVCICGWKSKLYPDGTMFAGPGGQLTCPDCARVERNKNIEVYGSVKVIIVPPIKGWHPDFTKYRVLQAHYYVDGTSLCKKHIYAGDDYLTEETIQTIEETIEGMNDVKLSKCSICEREKKKLENSNPIRSRQTFVEDRGNVHCGLPRSRRCHRSKNGFKFPGKHKCKGCPDARYPINWAR